MSAEHLIGYQVTEDRSTGTAWQWVLEERIGKASLPVDLYRTREAAIHAGELLAAGLALIERHAGTGCRVTPLYCEATTRELLDGEALR
jgi:hypothetical protein